MRTSSFTWLIVLVVACLPSSSRASGPLIVNGAGTPAVWTADPIPFNPDQGPLGAISNATAVANVAASFAVWAAVPTATVRFANAGVLPVDVTAQNYSTYLQASGVCGDGLSPIIFDTDGSITTDLFGSGAENEVLGFAGPDCGTDVPAVITEGVAVFNGRFVDGIDDQSNPEVSATDFSAVMIHEFGHYLNLDHSMINLAEAMDADSTNDNAIATMFPIAVNPAEQRSLHLDDRVSLSMLYPAASLAAGFGRISGSIFLSDGTTPFQGAYVIARKVGDPRLTAVGVASGFRYFPGRSGGPPPESLHGFYDIPGLPAGQYTVEIAPIFPAFTGGSSVGPLDPPVALPGPSEYWNGANEASTNPPDDPDASVPITLAAGSSVSDVDIVINAARAAANDACSAPTVITAVPFSDFVDTTAATTAASDPLQSCTFGGPDQNSNSVWYQLTAAFDGVLSVSTDGSDYDTVLTVYTGSCASPSAIACSDDAVPPNRTSAVTVPVAAGEAVLLEVTDYGLNGGGLLRLSVDLIPPPTADECPLAKTIATVPFSDALNTSAATTAATDPLQSCTVGGPDQNSNSVWYQLTAATDGVLFASTGGSNYDTVLTVYTGSCASLTEIACNDDAAPPRIITSAVSFDVTAGETVWIEIAGYGHFGGGNLRLSVSTIQSCIGDCDASRTVDVQELLTGIKIGLGLESPNSCVNPDAGFGGRVTVDILAVAVDNALRGCR